MMHDEPARSAHCSRYSWRRQRGASELNAKDNDDDGLFNSEERDLRTVRTSDTDATASGTV
jgi:hypothetical protein